MNLFLAKRLQYAAKEVISTEQTGFLQGRSIHSNLNDIQALIDHVNTGDSSSALLAVDYAKAFDTVRWGHIVEALRLCRFGGYVVDVVKMLFNDIKSCTYNAGFTSDPITPVHGIRQGCCCSPTLFVLVVEPMAIMVRKSLLIRGLEVQGKSFHISQYADDSTFFVCDLESVSTLLAILTSLAKVSGLQVNLHKSHLLLLGNHLHPPTTNEGIQVVHKIKILGVFFQNRTTEEEQYVLDYQNQLAKIQGICQTWASRSLSLKGKVTLINYLMSSLLQHIISCTPVPTRAVVEYRKMIVDFIWNSKRSKIAYNHLIQDIESGGLRLSDLETRIQVVHITLINKMCDRPDSAQALILKEAVRQDNLPVVFASRTMWAKRINPIYGMFRQILSTWRKWSISEPDTEKRVQSKVIWNNESIVIGKKPFMWATWEAAGIVVINDLLHREEARFLSHEELEREFGITCSFLQLLQLRATISTK